MPLQARFIINVGLIIALILIRKQVSSINSVLDLNGTFPYLINKTTGQVIEPRDYMDFENIYAPNETYRSTVTAQSRNYHMIKAFDFANLFQSDYWHYSSYEDLMLSAKPVADANRCAQHLDWLESRLNVSGILFRRGEQHVNLMSLLDAFGRPEAGTYFGHGYWLGSHYQCTKIDVDMDRFDLEECQSTGKYCAQAQPKLQNLKTRYCIGKARDADWPSVQEDNYVPSISYKVGLCLPESCETLSFVEHRTQLERLMRINMPEYLRSRIYLSDLYCLPDARSPIRALPTSTRIFLSLVAGWLVLLVVATSVFSCYKRHEQDLRNIMMAEHVVHSELNAHSGPSLRSVSVDSGAVMAAAAAAAAAAVTLTPSAEVQVESPPSTQFRASFVSPSQNESDETQVQKNIISSGAQLLFIKTQTSPDLNANQPERRVNDLDQESNSSRQSNFSARLKESPAIIRVLQALSIKENLREFQKPPLLLRQPGSNKRLRINLNALDSIKCLCCVLVIFGHIVFIHMQHLSNIQHTIELSNEIYPRILIAFFNFVDTFFIISGMLTAYFVFKRFNKRTFASPLVWLSISALRLLRLSPVYILAFWFAKTLTVHLFEGPIWDYGTDRNSVKGLCINDHWWKSLLYVGNLGTMQPLCVLPAWSIIVDAQYSLILPPVLYLLFRHKRLGFAALLVAIIISTANMSYQLATQTAVRTSDMAKVRLHVYPLISRFATEFYNTVWNRIGPVAIGILGGRLLYLYDIGTIRRWPWYMRGAAFKFVLFMHLLIFILPAIGRFTDDPESTKETDMTIFVLSNATIKPIWSLINTIFLLRLITDLRKHSVLARLVSHNIWHCLGKLCFASYLIHYEVILILLKSRQEGLVDLNWSNLAREFSLAFLISTLISYFIYILYEAPINKLITISIVKPSSYQKSEVLAEEHNSSKKFDNNSTLKSQQNRNPAVAYSVINSELKTQQNMAVDQNN